MYVQPEDEQRPRQLLQLLDNAVVADAGRQNLIFPVREGMRAGGRHRQTHTLGGTGQLAADAKDLIAQLGDVAADPGAHLDDRLMQLALDLVPEHRCARDEQFRHV